MKTKKYVIMFPITIEVEDKDEMYFNDNIRAISLRNLK